MHPQNCVLKDGKLCHRKNCVYKITCERCHESYIGSSLRPLHIRFREHLTQTTSSVFKHQQECRGRLNISIIAHDINSKGLRFKESIAIREQRPTINSRLECEELSRLTF